MRIRSLLAGCIAWGCSARVLEAPPIDASASADTAILPDAPAAADAPASPVDAPIVADVPIAPLDTPPPMDAVTVPPDAVAIRDVPRTDAVPPFTCLTSHAADLLVEIDNSNSMRENQAILAQAFGAFVDRMTNTAMGGAVRSLHVGVISQDLGTPGSTVPSCANSDVGDDGLLNPIRNGLAIRRHEPWTTLPAGSRPSRCTTDPNQYPSFLTFEAASTDPANFRDDFVCNALLGLGGCGLEAQLEAVYRALVIHDPRARAGNTDPNAGFVRDGAALAIVMLTDEEDGSVRDCRYAERGAGICTDAISAYDTTSSDWASADLNLRLYLYSPGSRQDPTWPLDRYMDPSNAGRGFTSLKPGSPQSVIFAGILGVPMNLPMTAAGRVDWTTLLGSRADGSDGYAGMSAEGAISMRQANRDPNCSTRVVPACRREGTMDDPLHPACDLNTQPFAWPSRRIAQIVRRFDEAYGTGIVGSICRTHYETTLAAVAAAVNSRFCTH